MFPIDITLEVLIRRGSMAGGQKNCEGQIFERLVYKNVPRNNMVAWVAKGEENDPGSGQSFIHTDPVTNAALDWFVLLREQGGDRLVMAEFEAWRARHPRHADAFASLERLQAHPALRAASDRDARRLRIDTRDTEQPNRQPARPLRRRAIAAALVAAVLLMFGLYHYPGLSLEWQADYLTARGERQTIELRTARR